MAAKKIGEVNKNSTEKLVVEIKEYKGKTFIDVRTYFLKDDTDYVPTKKGITIAPDIAEEVLELIKKAVEEVKK